MRKNKRTFRPAARRLLSAALATVMAAALALSPFLAAMPERAAGKAEAADVTLKNPRIVADGSMETGQKVTWDCVWFGSYPQAEVIPGGVEYTALDVKLRRDGDVIVSDSVYSALQGASGWDENNDVTLNGAKYRRIRQEDAIRGRFSVYRWDNSTDYRYFKYEPIKWRVLHTDGDQALLLSDIALNNQPYHTEYENVTWESGTVRSWLNGYDAGSNKQSVDYSRKNFIDSAFTVSEQTAIVNSILKNADSIEYGTEGGNNTNDKVFLLSESDVRSTDIAKGYGFVKDRYTSDKARRCQSSTYAKAMGMGSDTYTAYAGNVWWWLRSPDIDSCHAMYINSDGHVGSYFNVGYDYVGVRPALNLNLSYANLYSYAGTVCSDGTDAKAGGAVFVKPPVKKKITTFQIEAKKNARKITVKTMKKSKVKITLNKKILVKGRKKVKSTVISPSKNKTGKIVMKLSKRLTQKTVIKVQVSRQGYATKKRTVKIK